MGTPEGERDWVDVANDLLRKCQINLRLAKLADCNANVFIAFYEKILGEKVPDYIAKPCSQEDDFHNVQSVIDSLALDYLQISLSHITGENIVRGDKESIKNLLEIFDGLLEYLNEETSEEFHNGDFDRTLAEFVPRGVEPQGPEQTDATLEADSLSSSAHSAIQSSKHSLHSWNAEEIGSTNELIGLGDSARTFTAKQDAGDLTHPQALPFVEPLLIPIPQQPPYQTTTHHRGDTTPCQPGLPPKSSRLSQGHSEQEAAPAATENSKQPAESSLSNGLQYPNQHSTPALSENSDSSLQRTRTAEERETLEPTYGGPRTILFRTQTDLLPSLQDGLEHKATSPSDTEEEEVEVEVEDLSANLRQEDGRIAPRERKAHGRFSEEKCEEDPLSRQRQKNLETEQELHHMSVKMSRRLEELGKMLKRALVESGESSEVREEDNECQHNDSIVDSRPHKDTPRPEAECRPHPTLPTSPRACPSLQEQLEGTARGEWGQETGLERGVKTRRQTNLSDGSSVHRTRRQELHPRPSRRKSNKQQVNVAYEEELKRFEDRERTNLAMERLRAQEAEREYREAILSGVPRAARPSPAKKTTLQPWPVHARPVTARRRQDHPRKAPPTDT